MTTSPLDQVSELIINARLPLHDAEWKFRSAVIKAALRIGGNQTQAARLLGIHRKSLVRLVHEMRERHELPDSSEDASKEL